MNNGWVKLHRGLLDWEWYDDINTCRLFIHCLMRANHKDKSWKGKDIKRGSFFTSLDTLSLETGLSVRQIRTSLDRLISTSELASLGQARGRMITIVKYESYQYDDRLNDSKATGSRQADDRLPTTNNNVKNENKEKNSYPAGINPDLLAKISEAWNTKMISQPSIKLADQTQINKKRWAKIKKIVIDNPNYSDAEYWEGHIDQLSTHPDLQWQRDNRQLTFDQVVQIDKFERNLGLMRMGQ
jgi:hypothetical protein